MLGPDRRTLRPSLGVAMIAVWDRMTTTNVEWLGIGCLRLRGHAPLFIAADHNDLWRRGLLLGWRIRGLRVVWPPCIRPAAPPTQGRRLLVIKPSKPLDRVIAC